MALNSVCMTSDVYLVCLQHALSTEKEEVMGLLIGEIDSKKTLHISAVVVLRRSDKRKDRVEISPEQLSNAAVHAERLSHELNQPMRVLGWYHSHPHITVCPSHIDVTTQAMYQMMDKYFVGIIFSVFSETKTTKEETPDEDETFNVVTSLKKVSIFSQCHNLGQWNIWESLYRDIVEAKDGSKVLPEEAVKYCISACFFGVLWSLHHLEEVAEGGGNAGPDAARLKTHLSSFMDTMKEMLLMGPQQVYKEEAYLTICDLLVMFCDQLASNPVLIDLIYMADRSLQIMLNDFIQTYVFVMEEDDGQDEHSKIEELHKRRNFLASFCKLIVYNMIPTKVAADVFKHYVKYYNDYGDIIKATLGKAREINKVNCARTMVLSLTMLFKDMQKDGNRINRQSEDFVGLKELAKRFALSFGLDAVKNREAITAMHREGILFAVNPVENIEDPTGPPPNLPFLEILTEFTNKLLKQDKRVVLSFLDRRITAGMPSSRGEDWQPLLMYRNSLVHGETDQPPVTSKRAYGRKKKEALEGDEQGEEAEEATSDQEFMPGTSAKRKRQATRRERLPVRVTSHPRLLLRPPIASPTSSSLSSEGSISSVPADQN